MDISLIICISILGGGLLLLIISFIIFLSNQKTMERRIREKRNTLRIYVVDLKNDEVIFFNKANIKKTKTISLTQFYSQFTGKNKEAVINWIGDLVDINKDIVPNHLELTLDIRRFEKKYISLLLVQKVDVDEQKIFLESHLFKNSSRPSNVNLKNEGLVKDLHELSEKLKSTNPNKGASILFNFYTLKREVDDGFPKVFLLKFEDIMKKYLKKHRYLTEFSDSQLLITDTQITSKTNTANFVDQIRSEIQKNIYISSLNQTIGYNCAIVEHKYFKHDYDHLFSSLISLSKIATEQKKEVVFYERGMRDANEVAQEFKTEVESIIEENKLTYSYRPIVNVEKQKIAGYFSFISTNNTAFKSIDDLKNYASKTDDLKPLYTTIVKNILSTFIDERISSNHVIFLFSRYNERGYALQTVSCIPNSKECKIALSFSQSDLEDYVKENENNVIEDLTALKVHGFGLCLVIENNLLLFSKRIMNLFNYFVIGEKLLSLHKFESKNQAPYVALIEKLLAFDGRIIFSGLSTWSQIGLVVRLGLNFISSDVIAPKDQSLLPISEKNLKKLGQYNK